MAYDARLADRLRSELPGLPDLQEKKMFGGLAFLVRGNMACGVYRNDLLVRVGAEDNEEALSQPHTRPFDMPGRPMAGWILVSPDALRTDAELKQWIERGVHFAQSLPAK